MLLLLFSSKLVLLVNVNVFRIRIEAKANEHDTNKCLAPKTTHDNANPSQNASFVVSASISS